MRANLEMKLQHFILLFTIPALVLITSIYAVISYFSVRATILQGFDRKLSAISTTTAAFIDGDEHKSIKSENDPLYERYVAPMRRILQHTDLTYHYTVVPTSESKIMYVLDATEGQEHSPAGSFEDNPEDEGARLNQVMQTKIPSLSDIQQFDQWGELKIGSAPILDRNGAAVGLVGADVNISLINAKLYKEVFKIFGIGAVALLLALWASIALSRKFIEPIEKISQAALLVCAGDYGEQVNVQSPRELAQLATALNRISDTLRDERAGSLSEISKSKDDWEQRRLIEALQRYLANRTDLSSPGTIKLGSGFEILLSDSWIDSPSGYVASSSHVVAWLADAYHDALGDLRFRVDLHLLVELILSRVTDGSKSIDEALSILVGDRVKYIIVFDLRAETFRLIAGSPDRSRIDIRQGPVSSINQAPQLDGWLTLHKEEEHAAT